MGCSKDFLSFLQPLNNKQKCALLILVSIWIKATQGTNLGQEHKNREMENKIHQIHQILLKNILKETHNFILNAS